MYFCSHFVHKREGEVPLVKFCRLCSTIYFCKALIMSEKIMQVGAISVTSFAMLLSILISLWMAIPYKMNNSDEFEELKTKLICANCRRCLEISPQKGKCLEMNECEKNHHRCQKLGWKFHWASQIPNECANDPTFLDYIEKKTKNEYAKHVEDLVQDLGERENRYLENAMNAFSNPPRIIFHWFPHCWNRESSPNLTELSDYERDASIYTISTGPTGHCINETFIKVPETGLYSIYGKLTFACDQADQERKTLIMEVVKSNENKTILLEDKQENTCWLKGDLLTLYQSGLFNLTEGEKISLRYKSPEHVRLSSGRGSPYKSFIGAYRVGL